MGGFRRRVRERDGLVEGDASLLCAAELHQQGALHPEEIEISGELRRQRLDHRQRRGRTVDLGHGHGAIERDHRRRLQPLERCVEEIDLRPVGVFRPDRA